MKKRSKTDTVHVSTRMREPLRAKLEAAAKARGVSLNAELVDRLERSFERDEFAQEIVRLVRGEAHAPEIIAGRKGNKS